VLIYKELSELIIGAAIEVHTHLGPGFLESVYQHAMEKEMTTRGIPFKPQDPLPVVYKGELMGKFRPDFLVDEKIVVEIKAVSAFVPEHTAKAIHYLTATGMKLALLINFGKYRLEVKRVIL